MSQASGDRAANEQSARALGISPELLKMLVCPIDKGALEPRHHALVCTQCHREYLVEDGIPNMVVD